MNNTTTTDNTIFIQIASYRDSELVPTIKNCIQNSNAPENLRFCIAWQHGPEENIDELKQYSNINIIDLDYIHTKGVCWARNKIQQLYAGYPTKYTLQLDSHHRFVKGWDTLLIGMVEQLQAKGYKKPLLTAYLPSYNPSNDPAERAMYPTRMDFDRFIPEGAVFFRPAVIENWENLTEPVPARWYSAHFCFTLGEFCTEVQHDPEYLFHGEEISIAARAYTHGYDLFHPHKIIAWHEYSRSYRPKQWDDSPTWFIENRISHLRNRKFFSMDGEVRDISFGNYDFGTVRTLHDYEQYAGIDFKKRGVQEYTIKNKPAPNPKVEDWDKSIISLFRHCIDIPFEALPEQDYDFWCIAFSDKNGQEIYREDADIDEIESMRKDPDMYYKIWRQFITPNLPVKWIVWPHTKSKGWGDPIIQNLIP